MHVLLLQDGIGEIAAKYGLGVAVGAASLWFLAFKVWPWMTGQVERTQAARESDIEANRKDREAHQKNLDHIGVQMELMGRNTVAALEKVVEELKATHDDVREIKESTRRQR